METKPENAITLEEKPPYIVYFDKKTYQAFQHVLKAKCNDTARPNLCHIGVQNGLLAATTGQRMHYMDAPNKLPDGTYDAVKRGKTGYVFYPAPDNEKFPCIEKILPKGDLKTFRVRRESAASEIGKRTGILVDHKFLDDAINPKRYAHVYWTKEVDPILTDNELFKALIMPRMGDC